MATASMSIVEAARMLGLSEHTIRRRLKRGELAGEQIERPQGYEWRVVLPDELPSQPDRGTGQVTSDAAEWLVTSQDYEEVRQVASGGAGQVEPSALVELAQALAGQLAEERARSTAALVERERRITLLEQQRFELAGPVGYLQAQLAGVQEQIRLLSAPKAATTPPRRWWQVWRR